MGVAAILVMWPSRGEQTFVHPAHWRSICNVVWLAQWFPRIRMKSMDDGPTDDDGRTTEPALL